MFLLLCILSILRGYGQNDDPSVCRVEDGRLIFKLDLRWSGEQKKKISLQFSLDSAVLANAFSGKVEFTVKGNDWKVRKLNPNIIELSKSLNNTQPARKNNDDVIMVDDSWITFTDPADRQSATFGINKFSRFDVFQYIKETAQFFLPGYKNAGKVYLSGSFNNWSTSQLPLIKSDSGWSVKIKLKPGKYSYKYIIDGKWTQDPFNHEYENDTYSGFNSIVFCFNQIFVLYGFHNAKSVFLSGSFNEWNKKELRMFRTKGGWAVPLYLREGIYSYKFLVDGQWITDPANKAKGPDGKGNYYSYVGIGDSIFFRLTGFPKARKVIVAGDFNNWNTEELHLEKVDGGWKLPYILAPGNYEYKFIIDGQWTVDPKNSGRTGSGSYINSILAVKPNHTFILDNYSNAGTVIVTGSFNDWKKDGYQMVKKEGKWTLPLYLRPGKSLYKFIVDEKWILDPNNELYENNESGTGNSVLWIKP